MKKLFVSVPMNGRTEEEIKSSFSKMKAIAEVYEGEELELIDTWITEEPMHDCNTGVWYLAKSLELLSMADIFIGIDDYLCWRGCNIETETAEFYGIKIYKVQAEAVVDNYLQLRYRLFEPKQND